MVPLARARRTEATVVLGGVDVDVRGVARDRHGDRPPSRVVAQPAQRVAFGEAMDLGAQPRGEDDGMAGGAVAQRVRDVGLAKRARDPRDQAGVDVRRVGEQHDQRRAGVAGRAFAERERVGHPALRRVVDDDGASRRRRHVRRQLRRHDDGRRERRRRVEGAREQRAPVEFEEQFLAAHPRRCARRENDADRLQRGVVLTRRRVCARRGSVRNPARVCRRRGPIATR